MMHFQFLDNNDYNKYLQKRICAKNNNFEQFRKLLISQNENEFDRKSLKCCSFWRIYAESSLINNSNNLEQFINWIPTICNDFLSKLVNKNENMKNYTLYNSNYILNEFNENYISKPPTFEQIRLKYLKELILLSKIEKINIQFIGEMLKHIKSYIESKNEIKIYSGMVALGYLINDTTKNIKPFNEYISEVINSYDNITKNFNKNKRFVLALSCWLNGQYIISFVDENYENLSTNPALELVSRNVTDLFKKIENPIPGLGFYVANSLCGLACYLPRKMVDKCGLEIINHFTQALKNIGECDYFVSLKCFKKIIECCVCYFYQIEEILLELHKNNMRTIDLILFEPLIKQLIILVEDIQNDKNEDFNRYIKLNIIYCAILNITERVLSCNNFKAMRVKLRQTYFKTILPILNALCLELCQNYSNNTQCKQIEELWEVLSELMSILLSYFKKIDSKIADGVPQNILTHIVNEIESSFNKTSNRKFSDNIIYNLNYYIMTGNLVKWSEISILYQQLSLTKFIKVMQLFFSSRMLWPSLQSNVNESAKLLVLFENYNIDLSIICINNNDMFHELLKIIGLSIEFFYLIMQLEYNNKLHSNPSLMNVFIFHVLKYIYQLQNMNKFKEFLTTLKHEHAQWIREMYKMFTIWTQPVYDPQFQITQKSLPIQFLASAFFDTNNNWYSYSIRVAYSSQLRRILTNKTDALVYNNSFFGKLLKTTNEDPEILMRTIGTVVC